MACDALLDNGVAAPACSSSRSDCDPNANTRTDPLVTGFLGQAFEAVGLNGYWYAWYTDTDLKVYVKLDAPAGRRAGQYIVGVYMNIGRSQVLHFDVWPKFMLYVRKGKKGRGHSAKPWVWDDGCGIIKFSDRSLLRVVWQQYDIALTRRMVWQRGDKRLLKHNERPIYLNLDMGVKEPTNADGVDGVLGRTFRVKHIPPLMGPKALDVYRVNPPYKFRPRMANGMYSNLKCIAAYRKKLAYYHSETSPLHVSNGVASSPNSPPK